jgi:hypothetical protein
LKVYMGVDPGPSTGIVLLIVHPDGAWMWHVFQVDGNTAFWLIQQLYESFSPRVVAIEAFVPSNRAGTNGRDAELTRRIADHAYQLVSGIRRNPPSVPRKRKAAEVKPWANDKRLEKAGFPLGAKFKDARDAGRQAMFAAVRDGKERDPLA